MRSNYYKFIKENFSFAINIPELYNELVYLFKEKNDILKFSYEGKIQPYEVKSDYYDTKYEIKNEVILKAISKNWFNKINMIYKDKNDDIHINNYINFKNTKTFIYRTRKIDKDLLKQLNIDYMDLENILDTFDIDVSIIGDNNYQLKNKNEFGFLCDIDEVYYFNGSNKVDYIHKLDSIECNYVEDYVCIGNVINTDSLSKIQKFEQAREVLNRAKIPLCIKPYYKEFSK